MKDGRPCTRRACTHEEFGCRSWGPDQCICGRKWETQLPVTGLKVGLRDGNLRRHSSKQDTGSWPGFVRSPAEGSPRVQALGKVLEGKLACFQSLQLLNWDLVPFLSLDTESFWKLEQGPSLQAGEGASASGSWKARGRATAR